MISYLALDRMDIGANIDDCKKRKYKAPKLLHMREHGFLAF